MVLLVQVPGKHLIRISKCLEFQHIASRIPYEHGCLFSDFSLEADSRFQIERRSADPEAFHQNFPLFPLQDQSEMGNRDGLPVDRVAGLFPSRVAVVRRDLVAHQVKVDPFLGRAPDAALQNPGVEGFRR